jgi:membrane-associated phospholipid phosphatase
MEIKRHPDPVKNGYYRHFIYILILPLYLAAFFYIESSVSGPYFVSYLPLDDDIPFCEYFVVFYILWFPYMVLPGLYLLWHDAEGFARYMLYIGASFFPVILFCGLFPNCQNLRPESFAHDNLFTDLVGMLYQADTNTNVLPSIHVVGTLAVIFSVFENDCFPHGRIWKISSIILGILICASTMLIKQHSLLDVLTAIPYAFAVWYLIYRLPAQRRRRRKQRCKTSVSSDT